MKKILVVEDDAVSARMVSDYLGARGYSASVARNGVEAVAACAAQEPDLMLVDVALPLKNGFEVCFDVKRTEHGQRMPLLLMSAVYRDTDHAEAYAERDLRAQGYLSKPFELSDLLTRIEALIGPA